MATIFYRVGGVAEQSIAATYGQPIEIPGSAEKHVTFRVETVNRRRFTSRLMQAAVGRCL